MVIVNDDTKNAMIWKRKYKQLKKEFKKLNINQENVYRPQLTVSMFDINVKINENTSVELQVDYGSDSMINDNDNTDEKVGTGKCDSEKENSLENFSTNQFYKKGNKIERQLSEIL